MSISIDAAIFVAGHNGMVGSAIVRKLTQLGYRNILTVERSDLNLLEQEAVCKWMSRYKPEYVVMAAAKVGGIHANNSYPAEFIYENLLIQCNIIQASFQSGINSLLFLGSSCIYPKSAPQPMQEEALLQGSLEPTNEPYAIAKIAGIKLCESYNRQYGVDYRSAMPTNLYGPGDNYHLENSHVIPALLRKFHEAKVASASHVEIWGTGSPRREFLHVDDMAAACVHIMNLDKVDYDAYTTPMLSHINVGCGEDITIKELANLLAKVVDFDGDISFDASKLDGMPRKLMCVDRLKKLGWVADISLEEGLQQTYSWFLENENILRQ